MKSAIVWIPAAFIVGGLIGRFGPTEELRAYRRSAETKASEKVARTANGFDSFAALANIPTAAKRPRKPAASGTNAVSVAEKKPRRLDPEDLRARIDEAAALWRTRVELKRATTIEKLGLDAKGTENFDAAVANMNEKLRDAMQAMADQLSAEGAEMTPELGVRFLGDLSIAVAETYDSLGAVVPADKRGEISRLQLYEFVDPSAAEPLIEVQDRLDMSAMRGKDGR